MARISSNSWKYIDRSWNYFIRNDRVLRKADKTHKAIQHKIQTCHEMLIIIQKYF